MTRAELILIIRERINLEHKFKKREVSEKVISSVIENFFKAIKENVIKGEHIELRGFGTFETKIREPRKAINPKTKEVVDVKRHAVPIFRPGREMKTLTREYFDKKKKN